MYTGTVQTVKSFYVLNGKIVATFQNWKNLNLIFDLNDGSFDHFIFEMEFQLLGEIFRNVSFYMLGAYTCTDQSSSAVFCDDYMIPLLTLFSTGKYEGIYYRLHEIFLKYVSCGPASKENLSIHLLFNIFYIPVWIAIKIYLVLLPIILTWVYSTNQYNLTYFLATSGRVYKWLDILTLSSLS